MICIINIAILNNVEMKLCNSYSSCFHCLRSLTCTHYSNIHKWSCQGSNLHTKADVSSTSNQNSSYKYCLLSHIKDVYHINKKQEIDIDL